MEKVYDAYIKPKLENHAKDYRIGDQMQPWGEAITVVIAKMDAYMTNERQEVG